ncbi:MAG: RIP metalloprotease RseP [Treponema sp.]|nr:RIP metalloprotease RseP [Treponema sp.]
MLILKIVLGLFGLGIVVFIHELGHFLAARLVGINVEAFSIGWGNPILKKKIGTVEYRLGMFPVGGYCKMRGETDYKEAWENMKNGKNPEEGSYLAAKPAARILVSLGGPLFNLIFACLLLSLLWGIGFEINTLDNRIILASEVSSDLYPADNAGLKTGDRIIEIAGNEISYYHEAQENIALNPDKALPITVERNGELVRLNITPALDKSSGAGKIGVYFWTDPVIEKVTEGSLAAMAGLLPGDIITGTNGKSIRNSVDFMMIMEQEPETLFIEYERYGQRHQTLININAPANGLPSSGLPPSGLGFSWAPVKYRTPSLSFPAAIEKGVRESFKTLSISIKSLRLLFMGIDLTQAVSGPVRITYMMGDMATQSFGQGLGIGFRSSIEFISLISIALCVMNLLPLPILDGGMIILFFVELLRRKPAHPKVISVFQACGMVIIFGLMIFAFFGDIMYFVRR